MKSPQQIRRPIERLPQPLSRDFHRAGVILITHKTENDTRHRPLVMAAAIPSAPITTAAIAEAAVERIHGAAEVEASEVEAAQIETAEIKASEVEAAVMGVGVADYACVAAAVVHPH